MNPVFIVFLGLFYLTLITFRVNSNVDIIVSGVSLLKALNIEPGDKRNNHVLSSVDELQETFAFYFARGSAAERSFTNPIVYQKIIQAAETISNVEVTIQLKYCIKCTLHNTVRLDI